MYIFTVASCLEYVRTETEVGRVIAVSRTHCRVILMYTYVCTIGPKGLSHQN